MSSPAHQRSHSRSPPVADENNTLSDEPRGRSRTPNGANNARRTRSRSPSRGGTRSRSRSYRSRSPARTRSPQQPRSAKVVIEKLTKNVNEAHLREIFGSYGPISQLEMPMNKQFMTNRGIAYVLYNEPRYAEDAIAHMHEAQVDGAEISVSIVLPRRRFDRSPPPRRPPPNRFGEPHRFREAGGGRPPAPDRAYGRPIPPPRSSPGYRGGRGRTPPPGGPSYRGGRGGGGGFRDRNYDDRNTYRPRSRSPSRSPPPRRRRSRSYSSRSRSRSRSPPPQRRREVSPPPSRGGGPGGGGGGGGGGRRRRSPSYSSYSSRERSRSRGRR